jgi:crotonobetainyl-CoA:carnitine CoA-transferase CaiB-like acyl-CoA transferase
MPCRWRLSVSRGGDPVLDRPGPRIGGHSEEVLREAGFELAEIAALRTSGALG